MRGVVQVTACTGNAVNGSGGKERGRERRAAQTVMVVTTGRHTQIANGNRSVRRVTRMGTVERVTLRW